MNDTAAAADVLDDGRFRVVLPSKAHANAEASKQNIQLLTQYIDIDVNLVEQRISGWTEIIVLPTEETASFINLDCGRCNVKSVQVNGKEVQYTYMDRTLETLDYGSNVHQYQVLYERLTKDIPTSINIQLPPNTVTTNAQDVDTMVDEGLRATYQPVQLRIDFEIVKQQAGTIFANCNFQDAVRTINEIKTSANLSQIKAQAWVPCNVFPCLNDPRQRGTWTFRVAVPKTTRALEIQFEASMSINLQQNSISNAADISTIVADAATPFSVVGCGDLTSEIQHAHDVLKKVVTYEMVSPVAAPQLGIAVGPFVRFNLTEIRENEEDDTMGKSAIDVFGYCFHDRLNEMKHTCIFIYRAIDFMVREYGSFPYSLFRLLFLDGLAKPVTPLASLALCSSLILYTPDIIDSIFPSTKHICIALASQWAGQHIIPKESSDVWLTIGLARYIADQAMRRLIGLNDYFFRQKKEIELLLMQDIGQKPLASSLPSNPSKAFLDFIELKAPLVLSILDRRMKKKNNAFGLSRVIHKIFFQAMSEDLVDGQLSTSHFLRTCEKIGHGNFEAFARQWIFGSGYPIFRVTQRYNKKKFTVEVAIRQVQTSEMPAKRLSIESFADEALRQANHEHQFRPQPLFTGPITIRIHESDGTPYDHVVEIREALSRHEIPYHARGRFGLNRRRGTRAMEPLEDKIDVNPEVVIHALGDVLNSDEEKREWRLSQWSKDEEERIAGEGFEWMRIDADFEWICEMSLNQPDYMYISQLQQDRDVFAQLEAIRYLKGGRQSEMLSTVLVRTVMDERYYYGIRVEAAETLAQVATEQLSYIGQYHLTKAFQSICCFPNSLVPRPNDFSNFQNYFVACAIPLGLSQMRTTSGTVPLEVQQFLLDLLRYNDNSNNDFSDGFYLCALIRALANTLVTPKVSWQAAGRDAQLLRDAIIAEINRYEDIDCWIPSYQSIVTSEIARVKLSLSKRNIVPLSFSKVFDYLSARSHISLRATALYILAAMGGLRKPTIQKYFFGLLQHSNSPYLMRACMDAFRLGLGVLAMQMKVSQQRSLQSDDDIVFEDEKDMAAIARQKQEAQKRESVEGALAGLRTDDTVNSESFKHNLWAIIKSDNLTTRLELLTLCRILYTTRNTLLVKLQLPTAGDGMRVWYFGRGRIVISKQVPRFPIDWTKRDSPTLTNPISPAPASPSHLINGMTQPEADPKSTLASVSLAAPEPQPKPKPQFESEPVVEPQTLATVPLPPPSAPKIRLKLNLKPS